MVGGWADSAWPDSGPHRRAANENFYFGPAQWFPASGPPHPRARVGTFRNSPPYVFAGAVVTPDPDVILCGRARRKHTFPNGNPKRCTRAISVACTQRTPPTGLRGSIRDQRLVHSSPPALSRLAAHYVQSFHSGHVPARAATRGSGARCAPPCPLGSGSSPDDTRSTAPLPTRRDLSPHVLAGARRGTGRRHFSRVVRGPVRRSPVTRRVE